MTHASCRVIIGLENDLLLVLFPQIRRPSTLAPKHFWRRQAIGMNDVKFGVELPSLSLHQKVRRRVSAGTHHTCLSRNTSYTPQQEHILIVRCASAGTHTLHHRRPAETHTLLQDAPRQYERLTPSPISQPTCTRILSTTLYCPSPLSSSQGSSSSKC